ncbi:hypothetical protein [[Eubacterium] cellulosolvens]
MKEGMYWLYDVYLEDIIVGIDGYDGGFRESVNGTIKNEVISLDGDVASIRQEIELEFSNERSGFFSRYLTYISALPPSQVLPYFHERGTPWGSIDYGTSGRVNASYLWKYDILTEKLIEPPSELGGARANLSFPGFLNLEDESNIGFTWYRWSEVLTAQAVRAGYRTITLNVFTPGFESSTIRGNFEITEDSVGFKESDLDVWHLSYTENSTGGWHAMFDYLEYGITPEGGTAREVVDVEKNFNLLLRADNYYHVFKLRNKITQERFERYNLLDTNIWVETSFDVNPRIHGLIVDKVEYGIDSIPLSLLFVYSTPHKVSVAQEKTLGKIRYVFDEWDDRDLNPDRSFISDKKMVYVANYKLQYRLEVTTEHGTAGGEGWYDAGARARLSVDQEVPVEGRLASFGVKYVFESWVGDINSSSHRTTILMNSPKAVEASWRTDYSYVYTLLIILLDLIAIVFIITFNLIKAHAPESDH